MKKPVPDISRWLQEAKSAAAAADCGMYLIHNGVVRKTARKTVQDGVPSSEISCMDFSYDEEAVRLAIAETEKIPGIYCVRVWLNRGRLSVGDDIMLVLVGGDTRKRVSEALFSLVETLKTRCVTEKELTAEK